MLADELLYQIREGADLQIIDVRRPVEFKAGHVPGGFNIQLAELEKEISGFDKERPTAVVCASGYRSSAATSILARAGFHKLFNVVGGTNGWISAGYPIEPQAAISVA
jgi:rhodanese-related sulfurtransferase